MPAAAATAERSLRIGEVAELTGTTPRTIRYYEEIGLLGAAADRAQGKHRCYTSVDVARITEIVITSTRLITTAESPGGADQAVHAVPTAAAANTAG